MRRIAPLTFFSFLAVIPSAVAADKPNVKESNKPEVQARLQEGWEKVVFGKELDHGEYLKIVAAVAASVAAENPTPLVGYGKEFVQASVDAFASDLTREIIVLALKNPDKVFNSGKWEVMGGFATYEHRRAIGIEVPDRVERNGLKITIRKRMEWAVIDLPNTYQPYIRIRLKK